MTEWVHVLGIVLGASVAAFALVWNRKADRKEAVAFLASHVDAALTTAVKLAEQKREALGPYRQHAERDAVASLQDQIESLRAEMKCALDWSARLEERIAWLEGDKIVLGTRDRAHPSGVTESEVVLSARGNAMLAGVRLKP